MSNAADTVRVFIALDISSQSRRSLAEMIGQLQAAIPRGVKWVDPAVIHLTLKFLGNINVSLVEEVFEAMRQSVQGLPPFSLQLNQLGVFPNPRNARVLWVGVCGDLAALSALQQQVDTQVTRLGFALEKRPFTPHLTLGRVRENVSPRDRQRAGEVMTTTTLAAAGPWEVTELYLIRSTLTPAGAVYISLGAVPLAEQ